MDKLDKLHESIILKEESSKFLSDLTAKISQIKEVERDYNSIRLTESDLLKNAHTVGKDYSKNLVNDWYDEDIHGKDMALSVAFQTLIKALERIKQKVK